MSLEAIGGGVFLAALAGFIAWILGHRAGTVSTAERAKLEQDHAVLMTKEAAAQKIEAAARAEGEEARRLADGAKDEQEKIQKQRRELGEQMTKRVSQWGGR